jgi:3-oxoacyl-[acyl-carrier protein] reductase
LTTSRPHPADASTGRVAIVTGAARNIGRAISRSLAAAGMRVVVNANTSHKEAEDTVRLIEDAGGEAFASIADVTDPATVARMVDETIRRYGRIDALVNNAAYRIERPFAQISLEEWRHVLAVNLDAPFICSQACLPHLIESGSGTIVNIGGLTAHAGALHRAHVVAAKAGVVGLTKALALDLAEHGITVNCVVPGTIETVRVASGAVGVLDMRPMPPIGRRGEPDDIAAMVRFLCSDDARYITGQSIHVNGGGLMP